MKEGTVLDEMSGLSCAIYRRREWRRNRLQTRIGYGQSSHDDTVLQQDMVRSRVTAGGAVLGPAMGAEIVGDAGGGKRRKGQQDQKPGADPRQEPPAKRCERRTTVGGSS
jgi:hypothetical protein